MSPLGRNIRRNASRVGIVLRNLLAHEVVLESIFCLITDDQEAPTADGFEAQAKIARELLVHEARDLERA